MKVTAVIPAFNEAPRIAAVIRAVRTRVDEVLVVDDASTDGTGDVARAEGAIVIVPPENLGYKGALVKGMLAASGDIIVTLDADGEHRLDQLDRMIGAVRGGEVDVVLATRAKLPRWSERAIARATSVAFPTEDASTGLRAIRRELIHRMTFPGPCLCGTFVLESLALGARVEQFSLPPQEIDKPRRRSWVHAIQVWHVLRFVRRARRSRRALEHSGVELGSGAREP